MSWKNARTEGLHQARHWSILGRLTLLYVVTTAILLMLAVTYLYWTQVNNLKREDNDFLVSKIQDCRRLLQESPNAARLLVNEVQTEAASSLIKYYIRLLDDRGRILLETPGMPDLLPVAAFPIAAGMPEIPSRGTIRKTSTGKISLLMSAEARANPETGRPLVLQVALDVSTEEALMADYRWNLLAVVMLGILFSGTVGVFVTRRGLSPLNEITQATERITASVLHERIVGNGWPVELASLARSFDRMLDRLEDSFKRLSQFSADLAHELRTPINNLRGEAGVALSRPRTPEEYRRTLESSLEEYARLTRLIDNLLFLARADGSTMAITPAHCDARQSIEVVREFYEVLAEDQGVELHSESQGIVNADPVLFRQAVSNLLSNALKYTPRGGRVLIRSKQRQDGGLEVMVSDTGCGIGPEHLPHIFDRLYRANPARPQNPNGSGLGLAILKSIMTLHGGSVEVQSNLGKGTIFTLVFPGTPPAAPPKLTKM
jgi:two-component system, OmpR family, heavy metal sensor histidine kinase CusS